MSKQDKNLTQRVEEPEASVDSAVAQNGPALYDAQPQPENGQAEQSRQFNSWLDRSLPRLMQYLGGPETTAVTSPGNKAKH
jgi:hypothetical protein